MESPALRKECDDLRAQVSRQSDKNSALQAEVTSLQATVRELQEANVKLTTDLTSRSSDVSTASQSIAKFKSDKLLSESRSKKLSAQLQRMQEQVDQLHIEVSCNRLENNSSCCRG